MLMLPGVLDIGEQTAICKGKPRIFGASRSYLLLDVRGQARAPRARAGRLRAFARNRRSRPRGRSTRRRTLAAPGRGPPRGPRRSRARRHARAPRSNRAPRARYDRHQAPERSAGPWLREARGARGADLRHPCSCARLAVRSTAATWTARMVRADACLDRGLAANELRAAPHTLPSEFPFRATARPCFPKIGPTGERDERLLRKIPGRRSRFRGASHRRAGPSRHRARPILAQRVQVRHARDQGPGARPLGERARARLRAVRLFGPRRICRGPQVVIGSSMGGWLALLMARTLRQCAASAGASVAGLVLIAPAVDFTEVLMWQKFPPQLQRAILEQGFLARPSQYSSEAYLITRGLIA